MLRKLLAAVACLLMLSLFFLALLLGSREQSTPKEAPASLPSVGKVSSKDFSHLCQLFGESVPVSSHTGSGSVEDVQLGTLLARRFTWQEDTGLIISCIQPAEGAHALRYPEQELIADTSFSIQGISFAVMQGAGGVSAYYSTASSAYAFYLPDSDPNTLLSYIASNITLSTD